MNGSARTANALRAAGETHPGLLRDVNEDRFHVDVARGLYIVVDGVGGQAAGGKAADVALERLRGRLERETGPIVERVREAITVANNEIHRLSGLRAEWKGMACVLTVVVVDDTRAVVGHVGDTRLYKLRDGRIDKITRDHSPVGESEDAGAISELEAMRHPRRNEVYRDVGSERHSADDDEFIELHEIPLESDAALLLCSDGLTDLVAASAINAIVRRYAGEPPRIVSALIAAANEAGGKDNVTVVYLEGDQFARAVKRSAEEPEITQRLTSPAPDEADRLRDEIEDGTAVRHADRGRGVRIALVALLTFVVAAAAVRWYPYWRTLLPAATVVTPGATDGSIVVNPGESIAAALQGAAPGSQVIVEPGEYRDMVVLKTGVRLVSRVPRAATIRLPGSAAERDPAVIASGVRGAEFSGFRIVGDAATPLGTGLLVTQADVSVADVEITGAANVAVDIQAAGQLNLLGSDIHDNPGAALVIRSGASPRLTHNTFARNGASQRIPAAVVIERGADPHLSGNIFYGLSVNALGALSEAARAAFARDNLFVDVAEPRPAPSRGARGR